MNQAIKISLISKTYATDSIGNPVATKKKTDVFAVMSSINQSEFYEAGIQGLQPMACYTVRLTEYNGEDEIEDGSERLTVYRTYNRTDGRVELYTAKRKGQK